VGGLAIGISSFIVIWLYIFDELSYDRYHTNAPDIYRLVNVYDFEGVGENSASSPFPVAWTLKGDYPGMIENVTRVFNRQVPRTLIEHNNKSYNERRFFFADSTFFKLFSHRFIYGDVHSALNEINSVVITQSTARRYFGDSVPMGKTIRFEKSLDLKVTGVIPDVPNNSHFQFDMMASLSSLRKMYGGDLPKTWVWNPCWTYLLLKPGAAPQLETNFPAFIQKYFYDAEKEHVSLYLQPLLDIHLKSALDYEIEPNSNISYLYILGGIAFFLLIIAIINYLNLATATSANRAREIGIKKVFGATKNQLIIQFLIESLLISFFALIIALVLIELALPFFNLMSDKQIHLYHLANVYYVLGALGISIITGLLSGIYPAFFLSSFNPIDSFKGKISKGARSGTARKILVVIQFSVSITLIIITLSIFNQIRFMREADTGFSKKDILLLPISNTVISKDFEGFKNELLQNPQIISVTAMDDILGVAHNTHEFRPEGFPNDKWQFYPALVVRYDFLKTFGINLLAGRDYDQTMKTDPEKGMLINEAMVKHMGWKSNQEAIGKKFSSLQGEERVIGVFNNFNATSLHQPAGPFVLNIKETPGVVYWFLKYAAIKVNPQNREEVMRFVEERWNSIEKGRPFEYVWFDQELAKLYHDEEVLGLLALVLTLIIIFIASLGLYGLVAFMALQRTREIGIRRVMGATEFSLIKLLSVEFIWLVLIAIAIAFPLTWFLIDYWLSYFAYAMPVQWISFLIGGFSAFVLAMLITSFRALVASGANPVDTIKYE
jgi:putative ABC transport system permease protein